MVSKESPPSYNELYVPEMYLGKTDHSSSSSDVSMDGLSQADENSSSSEPLSDILMCQDEFYIHPSHRKVGCGMTPFFGQIRDEKNKLLMTALASNCRDGRSGNLSHTSTKLLDHSGKVLVSINRTRTVASLYSKDRVLGLIHGLGVYSSRLSIENSAGEEVMQVIRKSSSSFGFLAQGGEIAKIEKNGFTETYKVSMMQGLDVQTKALILSCSYLLYVMYLIDTTSGSGGTMGAGRRICCLEVAMPIIFLVVILVVLLGVAWLKSDLLNPQ